MELFDIGVNLGNARFAPDLDLVLERARKAGVTRMLVTGTSLEASERALELVERAPAMLRATAGVHPHDAKHWSPEVEARLGALWGRWEVLAVGECGLDYDRDFSPRPAQRAAFEAQLARAAEVKKPVFLHERAAHADLLAILRAHRDGLAGGVVHCFTGDAPEVDAYLDLDLHIGITGWICDERRGAGLLEVVKRVPIERLLIETDAPYLTPRTMRPKPKSGRNEPAFLSWVLEAVAAARGASPAEVAAGTTRTALALFGW